MTAIGHLKYSLWGWATACGLALAGFALVWGLFPEWTTQPPWLRPSAPRIVLASPGKGTSPEAWELRTVRSPALIALAHHGTAVPDGAAKQVNGVNPPMDVPPELPAGLGMPPSVRDAGPVTEAKSMLRRKDISGAGVSSGILKSPAFQKGPASATRSVTVEYEGGLERKHVEVDGWLWNRWMQAGVPWMLSLDIQTDDQGRITHVLLETPADDVSLNNTLIQSLYQQGRVQPPGACMGRVKISFSGTP